jgi:DNA repair protein RadD
LRPYQQEAVNATIRYFRGSSAPAVIVLPTGAGKSLVIAELARIAKGRVMVLAHVKELVEQNHAKYEALGGTGQIFSAGLHRKESDGKVIFGSVQSVARHPDQFDEPFSLLIIDECHRVSEESTTQYQQLCEHLRAKNPSLKILGLTATPYRMGMGWIYQYHAAGKVRSEQTRFFHTCVYELPLQTLIKQEYLTPPVVMSALAAQYHFGHLTLDGNERFQREDVEEALRMSKRATPRIVSQIIEIMKEREAAMIFCATVKHAQEVMSYLPEEEAALILGDTPLPERDALIELFKQRERKYLVNVSVLTTGFDAPHVDLIALLRPTESISLFQQIVGRGLRLSEGKSDCLILDYAGNGFDVFSPEVGSPRPDRDSTPVEVPCPECGAINVFWGKTDADGDIIEHYGRKCQAFHEVDGEKVACPYRYRFKECEHCGAENDIAAKECHNCEQPLVDPDKTLRDALGMKHAKVIRCAGMVLQPHTNKKGDMSLKVIYYDEDGAELSEYFRIDTPKQKGGFYHRFVRYHHLTPGMPFHVESIAQVIQRAGEFRHPDFVVAYKEGKFYRVREKLFDYQGRYRKANELY